MLSSSTRVWSTRKELGPDSFSSYCFLSGSATKTRKPCCLLLFSGNPVRQRRGEKQQWQPAKMRRQRWRGLRPFGLATIALQIRSSASEFFSENGEPTHCFFSISSSPLCQNKTGSKSKPLLVFRCGLPLHEQMQTETRWCSKSRYSTVQPPTPRILCFGFLPRNPIRMAVRKSNPISCGNSNRAFDSILPLQRSTI